MPKTFPSYGNLTENASYVLLDNDFELVLLYWLFIDVFDPELGQVFPKSLGHEGGQKHIYGFFKSHCAVQKLLLLVESSHFLQNLNSVLLWHLKV
jgi:hypothetical protein